MASTPQYVGAAWSELPDSPQYTFGEKAAMVRRFSGPWATAITQVPSRGSAVGFYRVTGAALVRAKGDQGILTVNYECGAAGGAGTEPVADKWRVEPFEVNPPLARHSAFAALTKQELDNAEAYINGADDDTKINASGWIADNGSVELGSYIDLRRRGVETFYLSGITYVWTFTAYSLPSLTTGGYVETPYGPGLPYIPGAFSWLRLTDVTDFDGVRYTVTRAWKGAPAGHWEPILYGS